MVEKFINYIEWGSWEEDLATAEDLLKWFCWAVLSLAAIYFGPLCIRILLEEVSR